MNLGFQTKHLSIDRFEPVKLNNFTILTGVNGSGKTHLLRALAAGNCKIDSIDKKNIIFFNLEQFKADQEQEHTKNQVAEQREKAWPFFMSIKDNLLSFKQKNFDDTSAKKIHEISQNKKKPIFSLSDKDLENEVGLKDKLRSYKDRVHDFFSGDKNNNSIAQGVYTLAKKQTFFIDDISQIDFEINYAPVILKNNFLPAQLGQIFLDYRIKEYEEYQRNLENSSAMDRMQLRNEAREKCKNVYGGSEPWTILNDFLNAYIGFRYNITEPAEFTFDSFCHPKKLTFTPKLCDRQSNLSIKYQDLSSGEQILFALALCMLKGKSDNLFPQLLLLDEIDATLHPSMIKNMLNVINDVLLPRYVKVILATHSPTTVALSPEDAIFVVNKGGPNRIEKSSKKNALKILTEGYVTLEEGIKIFDQISKKDISVISEGHNVKYLKKASEFFAGVNKDRIEIIEGIESISSKAQLKILYDFFAAINHDGNVFFVWDCDFREKLDAKNNTFPYVFEKNQSNDIASNGIENLFDEQFFDRFINKTTTSVGEKHTKFDTGRKKEFMSQMIENATPETFIRFKPLFERIASELESNPTL